MEHLPRDDVVYKAFVRGTKGAEAIPTNALLVLLRDSKNLDPEGNLIGNANGLISIRLILAKNC